MAFGVFLFYACASLAVIPLAPLLVAAIRAAEWAVGSLTRFLRDRKNFKNCYGDRWYEEYRSCRQGDIKAIRRFDMAMDKRRYL